MSKPAVRPNTGPMRFDDDWTGLFIRGDHASSYAQVLQKVLFEPQPVDPVEARCFRSPLEDLLRDLDNSNDNRRDESVNVQELKPFTECKK